jgi:hypothetical protein
VAPARRRLCSIEAQGQATAGAGLPSPAGDAARLVGARAGRRPDAGAGPLPDRSSGGGLSRNRVQRHALQARLPGPGRFGMQHLLKSRAGTAWTDDGTARQERGLKHRAENETRTIPIPPELVRLLRAHIKKYGTTPDGRRLSPRPPTRPGRPSRPGTWTSPWPPWRPSGTWPPRGGGRSRPPPAAGAPPRPGPGRCATWSRRTCARSPAPPSPRTRSARCSPGRPARSPTPSTSWSASVSPRWSLKSPAPTGWPPPPPPRHPPRTRPATRPGRQPMSPRPRCPRVVPARLVWGSGRA